MYQLEKRNQLNKYGLWWVVTVGCRIRIVVLGLEVFEEVVQLQNILVIDFLFSNSDLKMNEIDKESAVTSSPQNSRRKKSTFKLLKLDESDQHMKNPSRWKNNSIVRMATTSVQKKNTCIKNKSSGQFIGGNQMSIRVIPGIDSGSKKHFDNCPRMKSNRSVSIQLSPTRFRAMLSQKISKRSLTILREK